jgi:hypothetical protein
MQKSSYRGGRHGFKFVQIKGNTLLEGEMIAKMKKIHYFKNLLQNQQANFNQTWYGASFGEGNSKFVQIKSHAYLLQRTRNSVESFKMNYCHGPDKCSVIWKLSDLVQNQVCVKYSLWW